LFRRDAHAVLSTSRASKGKKGGFQHRFSGFKNDSEKVDEEERERERDFGLSFGESETKRRNEWKGTS